MHRKFQLRFLFLQRKWVFLKCLLHSFTATFTRLITQRVKFRPLLYTVHATPNRRGQMQIFLLQFLHCWLSFHGNYTLFSTYKLSYAIQFSLAGKRQQTLGTLTITLPESTWTQVIHNYFIVNKDKAIDWSMLQGSAEICRDII